MKILKIESTYRSYDDRNGNFYKWCDEKGCFVDSVDMPSVYPGDPYFHSRYLIRDVEHNGNVYSVGENGVISIGNKIRYTSARVINGQLITSTSNEKYIAIVNVDASKTIWIKL
jgi:hypothetical protein